MKVYYKLEDLVSENIEDFNFEIETMDQMALKLFMEKNKFKVMWALRSIEAIINHEGGKITINSDGKIDVDRFSDETIEKIRFLINQEFS